jgi:predicted Zn-dependent protease
MDGARTDAERVMKLDPKNERAVALLAGIHRNSGDAAGAIALVGDAVARMPDSTQLREVLATLYFVTDQPEQGQEQLEKLIKLQPREPRYRYQLAAAFTRAHKIDDAQHVLEDGVKATPDSDAPKIALVDFTRSQRSPAEAEKLLRVFIARNSGDYDLRLALAGMYQRRGAAQDALNAYAEIVKLDGVHARGLLARNRMAAVEVSQGHVEAAQKLIAEVLKESPHDDEALALRGTIEAEHNDTTAAVADLRAALRDQPKAVGLRRALARVYVASGQPGLAEEVLRGALEFAPKDPQVRVQLADVLVREKNIEQAVTLLEETVLDAPTDLSAREALVEADMARHDLVAARKAAEDLKTLKPDEAAGFYLAGLVAQADSRLDDSEKEYEHSLTLKPSSVDVLLAISHLEASRGQSAKAVTRLQAVLTREPNNALVEDLLGEVYSNSKDYAHAEEAFKHASVLAPRWATPYRDLVLMKIAANDTAGAVTASQSGLKAIPDDVAMNVQLANLLESQGRVDEAITQLDAVYKRNPRAQAIANNLAMLLATYRKDQADLDRARDLTASFATATDPSLLDTNGWVRFKRGDYAEALTVLERALERKPDSAEIRYHAAMAELHAGQRDRARDNLQSALSASGKFVGADEARAALASLKSSAG